MNLRIFSFSEQADLPRGRYLRPLQSRNTQHFRVSASFLLTSIALRRQKWFGRTLSSVFLPSLALELATQIAFGIDIEGPAYDKMATFRCDWLDLGESFPDFILARKPRMRPHRMSECKSDCDLRSEVQKYLARKSRLNGWRVGTLINLAKKLRIIAFVYTNLFLVQPRHALNPALIPTSMMSNSVRSTRRSTRTSMNSGAGNAIEEREGKNFAGVTPRNSDVEPAIPRDTPYTNVSDHSEGESFVLQLIRNS